MIKAFLIYSFIHEKPLKPLYMNVSIHIKPLHMNVCGYKKKKKKRRCLRVRFGDSSVEENLFTGKIQGFLHRTSLALNT